MAKFRGKTPIHSCRGNAFKTMRVNKKHLRDDFNHRCAYCDDADYFFGMESFHVDHFAPKSLYPDLGITYENLMYSCPYCNRSKGDKWVGSNPHESIVDNEGFENPTTPAFDSHFERGVHGEIIPLDSIGEYMWKNLNLMLLRHSCLYRLSAIRERIEKLKKLIEDSTDKEWNEEAQAFCKELSWQFYEYYTTLMDEGEGKN